VPLLKTPEGQLPKILLILVILFQRALILIRLDQPPLSFYQNKERFDSLLAVLLSVNDLTSITSGNNELVLMLG